MPRPLDLLLLGALSVALMPGCSGKQRPACAQPVRASAPLSRQADAEMILVAEGPYRRGSTSAEREQAYADYLRTRGRDTARKGAWFQREVEASQASLPSYAIDKHPVTQAAYAEFVAWNKSEGPSISEPAWLAQGFVQDYESEVARFNWQGGSPPPGRERHPVVLVTHAEAAAYCQWRGHLVGEDRSLPSADQFEKAARGPDGAAYPWGPDYEPERLNSADRGERDTSPVGSHPQGASALSAEEMAGNVFQWTSSPWPFGSDKMTVKGSAWDDHGGLGRAAAAHGRGKKVRHAIVGFRCATPLR